MEGLITLVDFKYVADYIEYILGYGDGMAIELDHFGNYFVEDRVFNKDGSELGVVVSIIVHHESCSAWFLVKTHDGALIEYTINYDECMANDLPF